jgi:hypothetical protein
MQSGSEISVHQTYETGDININSCYAKAATELSP